MNTNEIYPGIQTRALDGTEITLSAADSFRLHEVAGYIALTSHYMLQSTFVTGRTMLNRMSDEDREFFLKTVQDVSRKYSRIIAEEELDLIETFRRNGVEVNTVDISEFERAITPLYVNNDLNFTPGLRERLLRELGL
jgi:TRAP-type C4-dicarboxylate transport system substrate-binding protein